jgi:hypothetical protein
MKQLLVGRDLMENECSNTIKTGLNSEILAKGDPLLRQILKINASPILLGTSIAIILTTIRMIAAWCGGYLETTEMTIGFFEDPGMYVNFIAGTAVWTYYLWMPRGVTNAFNGLIENKAIGIPHSTTMDKRGEGYSLSSFLNEMQLCFGKWIWSLTAFILSVGGTSLFLLPRYLYRMQIQDSWSMATPLNLALSTLWAITGLYAAFLVLFFILVSISWLRRLFTEFTLEVRPLHPDHAGGLSPLGKFSLNLSYIITILGFILATIPISRYYLATGSFGFSWTMDVILGLGIYIIAAPFAFFAPLSVAHGAMKNTKRELLLQISQRFEREYVSIQKSLEGTGALLEENISNLNGLNSLYLLTSKFPVWPFNVENIVRFFTSFISPILLVIISTLIRKVY